MTKAEGTVTEFLSAMERGETGARERLWDAVYEELRGIAVSLMRHERPNHTLQPTALVHEAYARLLGGEQLRKQSRAYFFGAAAQAMRRILIEHARRCSVDRAGATTLPFTIESLTAPTLDSSVENISALDAALDALAEHDRRVFDVVMLRFFTGLSVEQTADALDVSPRTVKRAWAYGRTWLYRRIGETTNTPGDG